MGVFLKELNEIYRGISSHQVRIGIVEILSDQLISENASGSPELEMKYEGSFVVKLMNLCRYT